MEESERKHPRTYAAEADTAQYRINHCPGLPEFNTREKLMKFVADQADVDGLIAEFGVHKGVSVTELARLFPDQAVYGFDSFYGLPEPWEEFGRTVRKGNFDLDGVAPVGLPDNVDLVEGLFDDSLPPFIKQVAPSVFRLVHIDCDLYSSTWSIFCHARQMFVPGTVIVFDEYWNYSAWRDHEWKAFQEAVARFNWKYEYLGYVALRYQVAVKLVAS